MTSYNVYATQNIMYPFGDVGELYLTTSGFSATSPPEAPDALFEYKVSAPVSGVSVILFSPNMPQGQINLDILDGNGQVILGSVQSTSGLCMISKYTFSEPVTQGVLVYRISYSGFGGSNVCVMCNATITM